MTGRLCPICVCDHEKTGPCPLSLEPEYEEPEDTHDAEVQSGYPISRGNPFGE